MFSGCVCVRVSLFYVLDTRGRALMYNKYTVSGAHYPCWLFLWQAPAQDSNRTQSKRISIVCCRCDANEDDGDGVDNV